ncbi:MarR family transcriptional regulator [Corticibacterium sp. UT-5YL-CI-8]|nr:MarR family transcriptional regulator [Tianweitania sp. UT-5YL-CI-8]
MTDTISPQETRDLLKSLRRIARASDLQSHALKSAHGLTGPQLVIVMAVSELSEVTTKALADHADLSPATVVTVLDNLEQHGVVERYRSPVDRRIVYTRLTQKGKEMVAHTPSVFGEKFAQRFASLSPARRRELITSVAELAELMAPSL